MPFRTEFESRIKLLGSWSEGRIPAFSVGGLQGLGVPLKTQSLACRVRYWKVSPAVDFECVLKSGTSGTDSSFLFVEHQMKTLLTKLGQQVRARETYLLSSQTNNSGPQAYPLNSGLLATSGSCMRTCIHACAHLTHTCKHQYSGAYIQAKG